LLPRLADRAHATLTTTRLDWGSKAPMPTARSELGLAAAPNGKLYAVGGLASDFTLVATVEEDDPSTNTWSTKLELTTRHGLALAAAPNGKLYAVGGANNVYLDTVEEYDPLTNTRASKAAMPTARTDLGLATATNGKLYAVGGYNSAGFRNEVEEYDPSTNI